MSTKKQPESPCNSICKLDAGYICLGCFRSAEEIFNWTDMSIEQKQETLERCTKRAAS